MIENDLINNYLIDDLEVDYFRMNDIFDKFLTNSIRNKSKDCPLFRRVFCFIRKNTL